MVGKGMVTEQFSTSFRVIWKRFRPFLEVVAGMLLEYVTVYNAASQR